jgi:hypothetical protein
MYSGPLTAGTYQLGAKITGNLKADIRESFFVNGEDASSRITLS